MDDVALGLRHQEMKIRLDHGTGPSANIPLTLRDDCAESFFALKVGQVLLCRR